MTTRRGGRPSQVRPRPPSTGRPAPAKSRPRGPAPGRIPSHRKVERSRGLALPFRLLLALAVAGLIGGVLLAATGGVGKVASVLGSTLSGFVSNLTASPKASASVAIQADAPVLQQPDEPYTNQKTIDLVGQVPSNLVGSKTARIRVYVAVGDQPRAPITEIAVGQTPGFVVPGVALTEGSNSFTATMVSASSESDPSAVVTYILDTVKPRIVLTSPKNGAVVNAKTVQLVGQTQPRSKIMARNTTTNVTVNGAADESGAFTILLPITTGQNDIGMIATDPAGNASAIGFAVRKGSGALVATLNASVYQVSASRLPVKLTLTVLVMNPDGQPLAGAKATFSVAIPGVSAITSKTYLTAVDGTAVFTTSIPKGSTTGQASVVAIVKTTDFGDTTDRTVITIAK